MKFNWGTGIALFYGTFVAILVFAVIRSTTHNNSLVIDNYYEEDLKYQQHYNKLANAVNAEVAVNINDDRQLVNLQFPERNASISGEVHFFRPSDESKDFKIAIGTNEQGKQVVPIAGLTSGLWKVKINWSLEGKDYYSEETIVL